MNPSTRAPDPTASLQLQLRDIHPPEAPSHWPPAPGWWLLSGLLLIALALAARRGWRHWRRACRRRRILAELERLQDETRAPALAAGVSALLKRTALERFGRRDVAALTGDGWLRFLDHTGGDGRFSHGPGRLLAEGPYAPALAPSPDEVQALLGVARDWLRSNL